MNSESSDAILRRVISLEKKVDKNDEYNRQLHQDTIKKQYPTAFFIWPTIKHSSGLKGLKDKLKGLVIDSMDCYCLCEFQSLLSPGGKEVKAFWHPVDGFMTTIDRPTDFLKSISKAVRVTRFVLKYGSALARLASIPVPDISELLNINLGEGVSGIIKEVWGDVGSESFQKGVERLSSKDGLALEKDKVPKEVTFTPDQIKKIKAVFPDIEPIVCDVQIFCLNFST